MPTRDPKCDFCRIAEGGDSAALQLDRGNGCISFFPLEPATLGHTLIIPDAHFPDIWSLDESVANNLAAATLRVSSAIRSALSPDGLNVIQSNGEAATQSVLHLHIHIVPRWHGDAIGPIWPPTTDYSDEQKNDALERIQNELKGVR
jgi:histidine triad (HIT) family protein